MKRMYQRFAAFTLTVLLCCGLVSPAAATEPLAVLGETTILFTHDLHSHFLPVEGEDGGERGGYARLKTVIDREKEQHPDALVLDSGDFSIGTLFQTLYTTQAAELRTMGAMGFDATVMGNHEFDHKGIGFAQMLNAAVEAKEADFGIACESNLNRAAERVAEYRETYGPDTHVLPAMVCANYRPAADNPDCDFIQQAMDNYGVEETMLLERGGVTYGIFGLVGVDADDCAPSSGFALEDPATAAKRCVASLEAQGAEFIICLSHSGTSSDPKKSEDEILAETVPGIDVIVSGHTHTTLDEPVVVKDTYIVSASQYSEYLGSITLERISDGSLRLADYRLIPIDETVEEDEEIADMVRQWKEMVGEEYLGRYEMTYDQVLTTTDFDMTTPRSGVQENNAVGSLVADAFHWAMENLAAEDGYTGHTVTVTADGVLRASLRAGEITVSEAFDVLSMGVGEDGTSGFPLVAVYLTGKEVKAAMEVDASVTPIMPAAQLYMAGVDYKFNTNRMFFNRVVRGELAEAPYVNDFQGVGLTQIEDETLYRVVTGMYSAQMLSTVKEKSMGLLSLVPKDAQGQPITDFTKHIVYDKDGNELKEWYALAAYLQTFGSEGVNGWYSIQNEGIGTKAVSSSWNPGELLVNWNWITWAVLAVLLLLILLVVLVVRVIIRRKKKKSA